MASYTPYECNKLVCDELEVRLIRAQLAYPDRRTKEYKAAVNDAYHETIHDLMHAITTRDDSNRKLRAQIISDKIHKNADASDDPPSCCICTEVMEGRVFLKCGHEMCPDCFARHSRLSNTCPFCRDEFSSKPKKQVKMPSYQLDYIAESWADTLEQPSNQNSNENYYARQIQHIFGCHDEIHAQSSLKFLIRENAKILMNKVKTWYDNDIE